MKILYAEDNPQDADLMRRHLQDHAPDWDIEIVETGQGCLERMHETRFDLLLLDHRLSDMDGLTVLRTMIHAGLRVPVVLVTGSGDEELVIKALRLGVVDYVSKRGNYLDVLADTLRGAVEEHHWKPGQTLLATLPMRILYAEHLANDADLAIQCFAEAAPNFLVDVAATGAEALLRLRWPGAYDLALINLHLSDQSGLDLVRESRRLGLALPPFIVVSDQADDTAVIAALQLGAANYISKRGGYLSQLVYTIDQVVVHDRLNRTNQQLQRELAERKLIETALRENEAQLHLAMEALRQREETILNLAMHDDLTGLPNRRLFYDKLTMSIADAHRYAWKVAVAFIDLDHFKEINDTRGHEAGDKFLMAIAGQLSMVSRETDTCARLGGDEFALILPHMENKNQVELTVRRLFDSLDREFTIDGVCLRASVSIGVAIFPDDSEDVPTLLKRADMAMYWSKEAGRNTYHFWDASMEVE